jgi:outer membrane receptor protein involved in Fe transport
MLTAIASSYSSRIFKIQSSVLHTKVINKTEIEGGQAKNMSELTPSIISSFKPFKEHDFYLRAFFKRVFRMPTFNDLYYTFIGNKNLNPEYTNQYNLGFTFNKNLNFRFLKNLNLKVDAYYNEVEDKIIAMPTSNQFRWTMINLGEVQIRGLDVGFNSLLKFSNIFINSKLSYTYQKAQDFTDTSSKWYGGQIPYIPWHSGSLIINSNYEKWSLNYSFIYTGKRYEAVANIIENYAQPWYTHDLSLSKEVEYKNIKYRISTEVNNLFDQQYEVVQCYPMPGINYRIKLNIIL